MLRKLKGLSLCFALMLSVVVFAACGGGKITLTGAKAALEDAGATVTEIQKSELPDEFDDSVDDIKSAHKVEKGTESSVYLVEYNKSDDAVDAYTDIGQNKARGGALIMYTLSDTSTGDAKVIWDAFQRYIGAEDDNNDT